MFIIRLLTLYPHSQIVLSSQTHHIVSNCSAACPHRMPNKSVKPVLVDLAQNVLILLIIALLVLLAVLSIRHLPTTVLEMTTLLVDHRYLQPRQEHLIPLMNFTSGILSHYCLLLQQSLFLFFGQFVCLLQQVCWLHNIIQDHLPRQSKCKTTTQIFQGWTK